MAEPNHIPRNAVVVQCYDELISFTQAFAAGHLRFLMVVGPAGTGKSRAMCAAVADRGLARWQRNCVRSVLRRIHASGPTDRS